MALSVRYNSSLNEIGILATFLYTSAYFIIKVINNESINWSKSDNTINVAELFLLTIIVLQFCSSLRIFALRFRIRSKATKEERNGIYNEVVLFKCFYHLDCVVYDSQK